MNTYRPIILLTFDGMTAELLCSKKLQLLSAESVKGKLEILADYQKEPEGYSCYGNYYLIEGVSKGEGLTLETSAGVYKWL